MPEFLLRCRKSYRGCVMYVRVCVCCDTSCVCRVYVVACFVCVAVCHACCGCVCCVYGACGGVYIGRVCKYMFCVCWCVSGVNLSGVMCACECV